MDTQEITISTATIASRLAELCKQGKFEDAQKELFATDAVSIEQYATPDFEKETKGLKAILEKGKRWDAMVQKMNALEVSKPLLADNSFALTIRMDVDMKNGQHWEMTELCVYQLKEGKIISEQFFM